MKRKIGYFILLAFMLIFISFNFIIISGKEYKLIIKYHDFSKNNIEDIKTTENGESATLIKKEINNGKLELTYRSLKPGKTKIEIRSDGFFDYHKLFVHNTRVITLDSVIGDSSGDAVIPIVISILLLTLIIMIYDSYKNNIKKNLYQYKNMYLLGLILFLSFFLISNTLNIFDYNGLNDTFDKFIESFSLLSIVLLPIGVITFIFVSISNIILIKKEGFSIRNMLGIILGIVLCLFTLLPDFMYRFTYNDIFIEIHNLGSIPYYIYTFIETFIFSFVAYLECILIAVIILSIKAAKRIPKFNKDYIIILGCMINKDGSLTNLLKSRVDRAIEFRNMQKEKTKKDLIFIPSGGKGSDEPNSEALSMKKYLLEQGISEKKIIIEDKSTNTYENFKYSVKKAKSKNNIAFSTTNFHVFRAGVEASKIGINVEGIGSKTKRYFWINAFIREFIATLYYERKNHIIIFIILLLICALILFIKYYTNIL